MSVSRRRNNREPLNQTADTTATEAIAEGDVPSSVFRDDELMPDLELS